MFGKLSSGVRTIRNHWKKSLFFTGVAIYAANRGRRKLSEDRLMRVFCEEARSYGSVGQAVSQPSYKVTVILNPVASAGKGRNRYETYCAPLLHLAGLSVTVIRTEAEGQAKDIMELMKDCDAVLVAGGDGTLMEAVTGLLRRPDADNAARTIPIGVLPTGKGNKFARAIFQTDSTEDGVSEDVSLMASATMAVVRQIYRPIDVLSIENVSVDKPYSGKKLFALTDLQLGVFRDAHERMDKYWFFSTFKRFVTYAFAFTTAASDLLWSVPCAVSCGNRRRSPKDAAAAEQDSPEKHAEDSESGDVKESWISGGWRSFFSRSTTTRSSAAAAAAAALEALPKNTSADAAGASQDSGEIIEWTPSEDYKGLELLIRSSNVSSRLTSNEPDHRLQLSLGPNEMSFSDFVKEGSRRETDPKALSSLPSDSWRTVTVDRARLHPDESVYKDEGTSQYFSLDGESVDVLGALEVSLLPNKLSVFCPQDKRLEVSRECGDRAASPGRKKWWQRQGVGLGSAAAAAASRTF